MPSRAWVVTYCDTDSAKVINRFNALSGLSCYACGWDSGRGIKAFQCPLGLELLQKMGATTKFTATVSMPSRAWVVTARMSNILNFSWCFLCIPAIYRCILAYLPIFFNQLSKFLRCESPSTFLGTCLSHHSFIIFLVTNTNTLLSGLYLISIDLNSLYYEIPNMVSMPSRAYTSFLLEYYKYFWPLSVRVNALSGLYLISTSTRRTI